MLALVTALAALVEDAIASLGVGVVMELIARCLSRLACELSDFGRWVFGRWVFGRWVFGRQRCGDLETGLSVSNPAA
jgi:hypothetical protein